MTLKRRSKVLLIYAAGLIGLAVFLWGGLALMKARPYLPDQIVSRIAPPATVPDTIEQVVEEVRDKEPIPEDQDVMAPPVTTGVFSASTSLYVTSVVSLPVAMP